jgi:hypothetical protein
MAVKRVYVLFVLLALTLTPGCSSQCGNAKDSIASLEAENKQIKEKALKEWQKMQMSFNNSSWSDSGSFKVNSIARLLSDFDSYFPHNGGIEYFKNKDLISRIIVNNQKCFDPIAVAEAEQTIKN